MPIDPTAVGLEFGPVERSWTSKDALLYALGVGAGTDELAFSTENSSGVDQRVLPTYGVLIAQPGGEGMRKIGTYNPAMLVHGEQSIRLHAEIPVEGSVRTSGRVAGIYDKGSGAVVAIEAESVDATTGAPLISYRSSVFIRGEGGFGGERGPSGPRNVPPERDPDVVIAYETLPVQALLYRLSGDRNPLHSDPEFATLAGFDRPILHGLCTYGFTGRALLHGLCGSDPARFTSMEGRFSKPVFPGDTLVVKCWLDADGEAVFRTETTAGAVVIDQGRCTFRPR